MGFSKDNIMAGQVKDIIVSCLKNAKIKYGSDVAHFIISNINGTLTYTTQTDSHFEKIQNLSDIVSKFKYISFKNMGFDIDVDAPNYIKKYMEYLKEQTGVEDMYLIYTSKKDSDVFFMRSKLDPKKQKVLSLQELIEKGKED
jgi:CheY-specific phosphatase CheX